MITTQVMTNDHIGGCRSNPPMFPPKTLIYQGLQPFLLVAHSEPLFFTKTLINVDITTKTKAQKKAHSEPLLSHF